MITVSLIDNMTNATDGDLWAVHNDNFIQEGVYDITDHFLVTEKATPDMSVDVAEGVAYVENDSWTEFTTDDLRFWRVVMDASTNVSISSNASGSTRIDLICIKVDTTISPGANGELAPSIIVVEGTPGAGAPTTPVKHLKLAEVTVADAETSITNTEISDSRVAGRVHRVNDDGWTAVSDTWTYASWTLATRIATITVPTDATLKYSAGMRVQYTQATGGIKRGIITKVETTTLTVFVEDGKTLENEAITSPHYSTQKAPFGFPMGDSTWSIVTTDTTSRDQASPANGTWYNLGSVSLTVGIGDWDLGFQALLQHKKTTATFIGGRITLSTANNTESDADFTGRIILGGASGVLETCGLVTREKPVSLASQTTYYINSRIEDAGFDFVRNPNDLGSLIITAKSAYV